MPATTLSSRANYSALTNRVYSAIDALGRQGAHVRLLVSARDMRGNANEQGALKKLAATA